MSYNLHRVEFPWLLFKILLFLPGFPVIPSFLSEQPFELLDCSCLFQLLQLIPPYPTCTNSAPFSVYIMYWLCLILLNDLKHIEADAQQNKQDTDKIRAMNEVLRNQSGKNILVALLYWISKWPCVNEFLISPVDACWELRSVEGDSIDGFAILQHMSCLLQTWIFMNRTSPFHLYFHNFLLEAKLQFITLRR